MKMTSTGLKRVRSFGMRIARLKKEIGADGSR